MIPSSLARLGSASTCLYGAKSSLCELAATRSEVFIRSYATVSNGHAHTPQPLKYPSSASHLGSLLPKKKKFKSKHHPKAGKPGFKKNISTSMKSAKSSVSAATPIEGRSVLLALLDDSGPVKEVPIFRTLVPSAREVKKEKPTVIKPSSSEEVPSFKLVKASSAEASEKISAEPEEFSTKLGPGFVDDSWAPESWESEDGKTAPPHFVPTANVKEGTIDDNVNGLVDVAPPTEQLPVAKLAHGLERVLFNPGVHWLQDPRSHVYNFTPWLERIPKVNNFAFERLAGFITSSQDEDLRTLAKQEHKKFTGSTSSLSGMLSHIYFLISEHKDVELETLSQHFSLESSGFTFAQRMPSAVTLKYNDGVYSVDSLGSEYDDPDKNVLTWLGTLLENFLTKTPRQFKKFMRIESEPPEASEKQTMREAFRFSKSNNFIMRSQLDCQDNRLPGTGVFDIKTRAVVTVRMDILNYEENSGYQIKSQYGALESFEREYYDLVRSAFLKYSFQVRIGNMDGVMVAYHNTERIFGFQYISLDEMDERIYGPVPGIGDKVFNRSISLLEAILEEATQCYPDQSVDCLFETRRPGKLMDVFVQPAEWNGPGEKPVTQFLVQLTHLLDGKQARAAVALRTTTGDWEMKYSIAKVVLPDDVVKHNLRTAEKRKIRTLVLPSNVSLDQAQEYWENLSFSPTLKAVAKGFNLMNFTYAQPEIQKYRDLSKAGRALYEELQRRQAGKPRIVLGQGVYEEEESLFFKDPLHEATETESASSAPEPEPDSSETGSLDVPQLEVEEQTASEPSAEKSLSLEESQVQVEKQMESEPSSSESRSDLSGKSLYLEEPQHQVGEQMESEPSASEPESDSMEKKE